MHSNLFFIVGVGRSGTTLIRLMLNSHPDVAIPYETHFITNYIREMDKYGPLTVSANLDRLIADLLKEDLLSKWDKVPTAQEVKQKLGSNPTLSDVIDAIYSCYAQAHGKKFWGDKSDYLDRMHDINSLFPNTKFIHIIRDGRDVAQSVLKMDWGPGDIIEAAEWWRDHVRLGRCMGKMLPPDRYMEIRYEDLVLDTENNLRRICDFLGLPYAVEMLNYYKNSESLIPAERSSQHYNADAPPMASRTYAWKTSMDKSAVAVFDKYAKTQLQAFGYEANTVQVSKWKLRLATLKVLLKRMF